MSRSTSPKATAARTPTRSKRRGRTASGKRPYRLRQINHNILRSLRTLVMDHGENKVRQHLDYLLQSAAEDALGNGELVDAPQDGVTPWPINLKGKPRHWDDGAIPAPRPGVHKVGDDGAN